MKVPFSLLEDLPQTVLTHGNGLAIKATAGEWRGDDILRLLVTQSCFQLHKLPYPETRKAVLNRFERVGRGEHGKLNAFGNTL